MSETINENVVEMPQQEKIYTFRKFTSIDVFPMFKVLGKIGLNEFTKCFENESIKDIISKGNNSSADVVGLSVFLEAANVILGNLPKCEQDIYQILSQTSNLSVDEIKGLDMAVFFEMIVDFIKKDDFKDFFKVVSKLFK